MSGRRGRSRGAPGAGLALALVLAVGAVACGDDGGSGGSGDGDDAGPATTAARDGDAAPGSGSAEGPGTPEPQPLAERRSVTISPVVAVEPFAPAYVALAMGEFEAENLDVTISELAPPDNFVLLAQGEIQMAMAGASGAFMNAVDSGVDLVWTANVHQQDEGQDGLWLRNDLLDDDGEVLPEEIDDGLRLALGAGGFSSTSTLPVQRWIEGEGGSLADVEGVAMGTTSDMLIAAEEGSVDGVYATTPISLEVADSGCCTLVTPQPPFAASMYTMTRSFIEDEPDVARAMTRALLRTVRTYLQGDYHADDEVMDALADGMGTDVETLRAQPSLLFDPDMGIDGESVEALQEAWIEVDVLEYDEPVPAEELIDATVVDDVREGR
jgi:NitT/TauT family transport system substrate-binding protein